MTVEPENSAQHPRLIRGRKQSDLPHKALMHEHAANQEYDGRDMRCHDVRIQFVHVPSPILVAIKIVRRRSH